MYRDKSKSRGSILESVEIYLYFTPENLRRSTFTVQKCRSKTFVLYRIGR